MGKGLHKSLQIYLSKKLLRKSHHDTQDDEYSKSANGNWLLSPCQNRPKTTSFSGCRDPHRHSDSDLPSSQYTASSAFGPSLLPPGNDDVSPIRRRASVDSPITVDAKHGEAGGVCAWHLESPRYVGVDTASPRLLPANMDAIRAASQSERRFFVSPCGAATTGSLVEEARLSAASSSSFTTNTTATTRRTSCCSSSCPSSAAVLPDDGVAVATLSDDPYTDFRRSMQEMVDAHVRHRGCGGEGAVDWEFLEDLLLCFLELNDRSVHGYVLRAFADLAKGTCCGHSGRADQGLEVVVPARRRRRRRRSSSSSRKPRLESGGAVWSPAADGLSLLSLRA